MDHRIFSLSPVAATGVSQPVEQARLHRAKRAFSTRRIDLSLAAGIIVGHAVPQAGDLVLARIDSLGQHKRLEDVNGRRVILYPGDEILVVYGDRYATDQFHALVPDSLTPCHLVAAGGIASMTQERSAKVKGATAITPIGLVVDSAGQRLTTRPFAIADTGPDAGTMLAQRPVVIGVLGSSMNAGKTTTVAALVHAERHAGRRVGAVKVTGTGSGGDLWAYLDAGADAALDFTDAGYPSTYRLDTASHCGILDLLLCRMASLGMETVFVEIADGLLFAETADIVASAAFRDSIDGVIFAASDAMGAIAGEDWLKRQGLPPLAIAGAMTASPLAVAEVQGRTEAQVLTLDDMLSGAFLASERIGLSCAA